MKIIKPSHDSTVRRLVFSTKDFSYEVTVKFPECLIVSVYYSVDHGRSWNITHFGDIPIDYQLNLLDTVKKLKNEIKI